MERKVAFAIMKTMLFDPKKNVKLHLKALATMSKVVGGVMHMVKYRQDVASMMV